jgi:hypothetical protein
MMNMSSGLTSVTGTVTSSPVEYAVTTISGTQNGAGTTTLGTVGANKIWRIIGISLSSGIDETSTTGDYMAIVQLNGVTALSNAYRISTASGRFMGEASSISFQPTCCPKLTAGQTVTLVQDTTFLYSVASVFYVEESV